MFDLYGLGRFEERAVPSTQSTSLACPDTSRDPVETGLARKRFQGPNALDKADRREQEQQKARTTRALVVLCVTIATSCADTLWMKRWIQARGSNRLQHFYTGHWTHPQHVRT